MGLFKSKKNEEIKSLNQKLQTLTDETAKKSEKIKELELEIDELKKPTVTEAVSEIAPVADNSELEKELENERARADKFEEYRKKYVILNGCIANVVNVLSMTAGSDSVDYLKQQIESALQMIKNLEE